MSEAEPESPSIAHTRAVDSARIEAIADTLEGLRDHFDRAELAVLHHLFYAAGIAFEPSATDEATASGLREPTGLLDAYLAGLNDS